MRSAREIFLGVELLRVMTPSQPAAAASRLAGHALQWPRATSEFAAWAAFRGWGCRGGGGG
eukprot:scaffold97509_cov31-Tisochrysis_lutea.AAC.2